MKIAIYSSCGNGAESERMASYHFLPTRASEWDRISKMFPEHEFRVYFGFQGGATIDEDGYKILEKAKNVPYTVIPFEYTIDEIAELIAADSPDVAIAFSTPSIPYDWGAVRNSLIAEKLREKGIKTIAHNTSLSEEAFEKHKINKRLRELGFNIPEGIFINKGIYDANLKNAGIVKNVYREYVKQRIDKLPLPVVIKNDAGAGSVGFSVAYTTEEALKTLDIDNSGVDLIVEKMIKGIIFGVEIYGADGDYGFKGPIIFSPDENGVTDPFASVKYGPVKNDAFNVSKLKNDLLRMAKELEFCGSMQIDLMYSEGNWYIIELNPRFSLMAMIVSAIEDKDLFQNYLEPALPGINKDLPASEQKYALDFKTLVYNEETITNVCRDFNCIKSAMRFRLAEGDKTEEYTEITVGGFNTPEDLISEIKKMREMYPQIVSEAVLNNTTKIINYAENYTGVKKEIES